MAPSPRVRCPGAPVLAVALRLYAAPVPGGVALVAPEAALDDLHDLGHLLAHRPQPVALDLLVAARLVGDQVAPQARVVLRRAAAAASMRGAAPRVGPRGGWYAALLAWGWLLLFAAADNPAQVFAGVWLVAGLPWVRRAYRRRADTWLARAAVGLDATASEALPVPLRQLEHAGLAQVQALFDEPAAHGAAACRAAAVRCATLGLADLAPFYEAIAAGGSPPGVWAPLLLPPAVEAPAPPDAAQAAGRLGPEPAPEAAAGAEPVPAGRPAGGSAGGPAGGPAGEGGVPRTSSTVT